MIPEDIIAIARAMLAGGPFEVHDAVRSVTSGPEGLGEVASSGLWFAHPAEDVVQGSMTFDLGDDIEVPATESLYSAGQIYHRDGEDWVALDVAGIASTVLGPIVWLTGTTGVTKDDQGFTCTVDVDSIVEHAPVVERDLLESALSMASLDLLGTFDIEVRVDGKCFREVTVATDWTGHHRGDGVIAHRAYLTIEPTGPRSIVVPSADRRMPADAYIAERLDST